MPARSLLGTGVVVAALLATLPARAFDESKYPDLKGQWLRARVEGVTGQASFDPTKRAGAAQQAPLTTEYQKIFEANLVDQAEGGQGIDPTYTCLSPGMPRIMNAYDPIEVVIEPDTTHLLMQHIHDARRIYTDGRDWPPDLEPSFAGYSIGHWRDPDGTGRYTMLEAETRGFKGPRTYDALGLPLHNDNQTIIKERFSLDPANKNLLRDEITIVDHALTRPWTATKIYRRNPQAQPVWRESICAENNPHLEIGHQGYYLSADGLLMPTKKDQPPPDLRYFNKR
jgi:hypothetical protein